MDFSPDIAIERKMSLDELCQCYGKERKRFQKEFSRGQRGGSQAVPPGRERQLGKGFGGD